MSDETNETRPATLTGSVRGGMKRFEEALTRALLEQDGKKLRRIADRLVAHAANSKKIDLEAIKTVLDRVDGKPRQGVELSGPNGGAISMRDEGSALGRARRVAYLFAEAALERASKTVQERGRVRP